VAEQLCKFKPRRGDMHHLNNVATASEVVLAVLKALADRQLPDDARRPMTKKQRAAFVVHYKPLRQQAASLRRQFSAAAKRKAEHDAQMARVAKLAEQAERERWAEAAAAEAAAAEAAAVAAATTAEDPPPPATAQIAAAAPVTEDPPPPATTEGVAATMVEDAAAAVAAAEDVAAPPGDTSAPTAEGPTAVAVAEEVAAEATAAEAAASEAGASERAFVGEAAPQ